MDRQRKGKVVQINTVCNTSTGRIMGDIQREAKKRGYETVSFVGRRKPFMDLRCVKFGNAFSFGIHVVLNTLFDCQGYGSWLMTRQLIRKLREEKPDIIHLHNLHGYYLYLPLLFRYLREEYTGKVFWTFHDCWPFTGHCAYFTMAGCKKWEIGCHHCPNKKEYPISLLLDLSDLNYRAKKKMFCGMRNLTILVPSKWMEGLVKKSFFRGEKVLITSNGIDIDTFSYRVDGNVLKKYKIPEEKKILLGVASMWDKRKGMNDFLQLSKALKEEYQIVLVGLSRKQILKLPDNIIGIKRTENIEELVTIYSRADIFINPSVEESFSLVTVEAFACGTPVIVLDTSAVRELVTDENGIVLSVHGVPEYLEAIDIIERRNFERKVVAKSAEKYDNQRCIARIMEIYEEALQGKS